MHTHTQLTEKGRKKENMTKTEFSFKKYNKMMQKMGQIILYWKEGRGKVMSSQESFIHYGEKGSVLEIFQCYTQKK